MPGPADLAQSGSGPSGSGPSGSGTAGSGTAGSGTAGSGLAGTGTPGAAEPAGTPRRRAFLLGGLGAGVAGAVAGAAGGYAYRATRPASAGQQALADAEAGVLPPVPFHGKYQAGILPPAARQTAVISLNATADGRGELIQLFRTITDRARFLTAGGTPPPVGIGGAPSDSGTLGPAVVPDGLTVTLGVGSTLFDERYGLSARLPARLTPMRTFPDDNLDIGLLFTCFQQDLKRQFEAVQTRLIGEPLVDYISPFGGGYFLALPGVRDGSDYLGRSLLA
jgi:deferrochelatase/peroxidase EfeB